MPQQATIERAQKDKREGKSPSTQAGEFVREEFHHLRAGKNGARSARQAIAIGLSQARRAGVELPTPQRGITSEKVRRQAERDLEKTPQRDKTLSKTIPRRPARAVTSTLRKERQSPVPLTAISRQGGPATGHPTARERTAAARRAVRTRQEYQLS